LVSDGIDQFSAAKKTGGVTDQGKGKPFSVEAFMDSTQISPCRHFSKLKRAQKSTF
jgi:hypothetical protein